MFSDDGKNWEDHYLGISIPGPDAYCNCPCVNCDLRGFGCKIQVANGPLRSRQEVVFARTACAWIEDEVIDLVRSKPSVENFQLAQRIVTIGVSPSGREAYRDRTGLRSR